MSGDGGPLPSRQDRSPAGIQRRYDAIADAVDPPTRGEVLAFLHGSGPLRGAWFGDGARGERGVFWWRRYLAVLEAPIPMVLHCPSCGSQHIDAPTPEWPNPPHRSHLCGTCGCIWRPADVPTVGVERVETRSTCDNWFPDGPLGVPMQDEGDLSTTPLRGFASRDIKQGEAITAADITVGPAIVDVPLMLDEPEPTLLPACNRAPVGWRCTRGMAHEGPCATVPIGSDAYVPEGS